VLLLARKIFGGETDAAVNLCRLEFPIVVTVAIVVVILIVA
jgi:hypothetical protein